MFNYLSIELTNRCNKKCWFCGRANARKAGTMELGDMDIDLFEGILEQYTGDVIQFHRDGEPLLYYPLWRVGYLCRKAGKISNITTNGILLMDKIKEVQEFDTICVSVFENDREQYETVREFADKIDIPIVIKFLNGYYNPEYERLGFITKRAIHHPVYDKDYPKTPPIPELGICFDFLFKPSIDHKGNLSICNRFDPDGHGILGDLNKESLMSLWLGEKRQDWLDCHKKGRRSMVKMCKTCHFWGIPACG